MPLIENIEIVKATIPRRSAFDISRGIFVVTNRVFVKVAWKLMKYASDCRSHLVFEHTLLCNELAVHAGIVRVPEKPGLGIAVDEAALARYAQGGWVATTRQ